MQLNKYEKGNLVISMNTYTVTDEKISFFKSLLGDEIYQKVYKFYFHACTVDSYTHKIFLTRRSYILYRLFMTIFKRELDSFKIQGTVYNSHSVKALRNIGNKLGTNKLLILDDIIINGRTIKGVIDELAKHFEDVSPENVNVWCMVGNEEAKCLDAIEDYITNVDYVSQDIWRVWSGKLTELIVSSNIGYVSFVDPHYLNVEYWSAIESKFISNSSFLQEPSNDELFTQAGITALILKFGFACDLEKKYNVTTCLRIYLNNEFITVIPYVFLPALIKSQAIGYCQCLLSELNITPPNSLLSETNEIQLYQWTVWKLSEELYKEFCKQLVGGSYPCFESFAFVSPNLHMTNIHNDNILTEAKSSDVKTCCDELRKVSETKKYPVDDYSLFLKEYLYKMSQLDEDRAAKGAGRRHIGIRFQDIMKLLITKDDPKLKFRCLATIVNSWDVGKSSYVIDEDDTDEGVVISGFIRNGEQSFRLLCEVYSLQYRVFYFLFLKTCTCDRETMKNVAEILDNQFKTQKYTEFVNSINFKTFLYDLLSVHPIEKHAEQSEYEETRNFINDNIDRIRGAFCNA